MLHKVRCVSWVFELCMPSGRPRE